MVPPARTSINPCNLCRLNGGIQRDKDKSQRGRVFVHLKHKELAETTLILQHSWNVAVKMNQAATRVQAKNCFFPLPPANQGLALAQT